MDKKKSILNVGFSVLFKFATVFVAILVRRQLILSCGNEVNGLNSLYLSIIGFLAIAELGVGSAITFCMYRPIVEGDYAKIGALYRLFRRLYLLIGGIILLCGLAITPFIHFVAKDYQQMDVHLHSAFILMLISVAITYLFGADLSLLNAHKNNYITTAINSGGLLLQYVLQIVVLEIVGSFYAYLCCRIVAALGQWLITRRITRKKYAAILQSRGQIDGETRADLVKRIRAMFMHKVGGLLVNSTNSIVISSFSGVATLGRYSNYQAISGAMVSVIDQVFISLTSIFGHLYVQENKKVARDYFEMMHLLNFLLGEIFFLGYYAVIDGLVSVLFGDDLRISQLLLMVHTANGLVRFMRNSALIFRDATGTFYEDRWKPLVEGVANLALSLALVPKFGVVGVISATLITNLFVCHIAEPFVLYKYAFSMSAKRYFLRNYGMILVFAAEMLLMDAVRIEGAGILEGILLNGCVSLVISLSVGFIAVLANKKLLHIVMSMMRRNAK